jgi:hypothetical protein
MIYIVFLCLSLNGQTSCDPISQPLATLTECMAERDVDARVPLGATSDPREKVVCLRRAPDWVMP